MDVNPVAPDRRKASEAVSIPAIILMIVGIISGLVALFGVISSLIGGGAANIPPEMLNDPNTARIAEIAQQFSGGAGVFVNLLSLGLSGVVLYGALQMKNLRNYGLALASAIIAIIPCFGSCCCIGMPFGIWALVVLLKPEVKAAFGATPGESMY